MQCCTSHLQNFSISHDIDIQLLATSVMIKYCGQILETGRILSYIYK